MQTTTKRITVSFTKDDERMLLELMELMGNTATSTLRKCLWYAHTSTNWQAKQNNANPIPDKKTVLAKFDKVFK